MIVREIRPGQLAQVLREEDERLRKIIRIAIQRAARRFAAYLRSQCDALGITDQGIFKRSIHVVISALGKVEVVADAPHAGVVEEGCRPHGVSPEGREAIAEWCMRKLGLSEKEAQSASWGIANKIRREGQKGHWIFRDSFGKAYDYYGEELSRLAAEMA